MKKNIAFVRVLSLLLLAALAMGVLAACGSGSRAADNYNTAMATDDVPMAEAPAEDGGWAGGYGGETAMMEEEVMVDQAYDDAATAPTLTQPQDDRKVIMNAWVSMEALDFNAACTALQKAADEAGGYISYTDLTGSTERGDRYAHYTMRIPAENYTAFMGKMDGAGSVTSRSESSQDVTDQYFDLEARLKSLRAQEERLLAMMAETAKLSDIIAVQDQLTEVQYEIESYEGSRRSLAGLISYSTVDVTVQEVQATSLTGGEDYGTEISTAFRESWQAVGNFFKQLGVGLVWFLPVLLIVGIPVLVIVILAVRSSKKRRAAREQAQAQAPAWMPAPPPAGSAAPEAPAQEAPPQDGKQ